MNGLPHLVVGVDCFTLADLLQRVASHCNLALHIGVSKAYSGPIKVYELDDKLLATLAGHKINRQPRPDCQDTVFTLIDENPHEQIPGWVPSNFWNFKPAEEGGSRFDLQITLSVDFHLDQSGRGIWLLSKAHGSFVSPAGALSHARMFRALVSGDENVPEIAKRLAASDGQSLVSWQEIGLEGLMETSALFSQFARGNGAIESLGHRGEIFNPRPYYSDPGFQQRIFISRHGQLKVIHDWTAQLEQYRASLMLW
ncbi:MAG TPA: hypothetical protein P5328_00490 [Candidatus Paceibacterota bacterium]|nr:hypothetical protein [Candidatus Paceibacterota bacterium]HRZ34198.1 hypothetical protein [Candidatus Paceibacterota bacterium]